MPGSHASMALHIQRRNKKLSRSILTSVKAFMEQYVSIFSFQVEYDYPDLAFGPPLARVVIAADDDAFVSRN